MELCPFLSDFNVMTNSVLDKHFAMIKMLNDYFIYFFTFNFIFISSCIFLQRIMFRDSLKSLSHFAILSVGDYLLNKEKSVGEKFITKRFCR